MDAEVTGFTTLQMSWGGLFDGRPADDYAVHLVRSTKGGTPGPTLCGIDRFAKDAPGWSVGGGISGPSIVHTPCLPCAAAAVDNFSDLPVSGLGSKEITETIRRLRQVLAVKST